MHCEQLNLPGSQLFRADRNTRGGGVLLEDMPSSGFVDCLWFKLSVRAIKLIVAVCYHSPVSSSLNDEALLSMFNSVDKLAVTNTCTMVM